MIRGNRDERCAKNGCGGAPAEAKSVAESMLNGSRLTNPRHQLKAGAALLIKGVNRWRTD
jgi:hypothetical protein